MSVSANSKIRLTDINNVLNSLITKAKQCACNCNWCNCECNYCTCNTNVCSCNSECNCQCNYCSCDNYCSDCTCEDYHDSDASNC